MHELLALDKYRPLAFEGRLGGCHFGGMTTLAVRDGREVKKRAKELMTSLINGALQRRALVFPADDSEIDDQFTTHTHTLSNGNVVYSKGNDHIIPAYQRAGTPCEARCWRGNRGVSTKCGRRRSAWCPW